MNKTVVFVTFTLLACVGLSGAVLILLIRPDASATFISLLITVLGLSTSAAATFYALGKQGEKIDEQGKVVEKIEKQTNGTLSALRRQIAMLQADKELLLANAHPDDLDNTVGHHVLFPKGDRQVGIEEPEDQEQAEEV